MSIRESYVPGTPCWVDVAVPDLEAGRAFYADLFGWEIDADESGQFGGYTQLLFEGRRVAGLGPAMDPSVPPAWSNYIAVANLEETAAKVSAAGGQIVTPLLDIEPSGRMFGFVDPTGAYCGVWQAGEHIGAQRVNEVSTWAWSDVNTREPEAVKAFYGEVFGWVFEAQGPGETEGYEVILVDGQPVGGVMPMNEQFPKEVPNHWMVYFAVADVDTSCERLISLGGKVMVPKFSIGEIGDAAVVSDPFGAVFTLMRMNQEV